MPKKKKSVCVCVFFFSECERVCPSFAHVYVKTSSVDLYQKPKTLQSVLVSLVLRYLDESNKIDKSLKKKKEREKKKRIITAHLEFCFFSVKFWSKGFVFYS